MLKGLPEMPVIFHSQPNPPGIKLRVGDDWHFRLLKDTYRTTNELRDRGGVEGLQPYHLLAWVEFFRAPDNMNNVRISLLESNKTAEQ